MNLSYMERKKGWWFETKSLVPCALDKQGLICKFNLKDVLETLTKNYPSVARDTGVVWFFNESRDREIAEQDGEYVYANPQLLLLHFTIPEFLTPEQIDAIDRVYVRNPDGATTRTQFFARVARYGEYCGLNWCGMFLGIEKDGYTHS